MDTSRHLLTPFVHLLDTFLISKGARDYLVESRKQRKTVLFPLFSLVLGIRYLVAGRVETEKSVENSVFYAVFRAFLVFSELLVHFLRFRGRLRRGLDL